MGAQLQQVKKILEDECPGATRMILRQPQNTVVENGADVLEDIWRSADCEVPTANPGTCTGLLRNIRDALVGIKEDAFGSCLCCRTMIGLRRRRRRPGRLCAFDARKRPTATTRGFTLDLERKERRTCLKRTRW